MLQESIISQGTLEIGKLKIKQKRSGNHSSCGQSGHRGFIQF